MIIVAQRISTIMHAEQILVLDDGKIVGKGTHKELLRDCPEYYQIASSQLSEKGTGKWHEGGGLGWHQEKEDMDIMGGHMAGRGEKGKRL